MEAVGNVQQSVPVIKKESTGSTGSRGYKYATLKQTWQAAQAAIKQNDLVVSQSPTAGEHGGMYFETTIFHTKSGEWINNVMTMTITKDDPQSIGAAITYYRRYTLTSMLGLIADDDDDATEHKLATSQQKGKIVGAIRQYFPEAKTPSDINKVLNDIVGKHPSYIREDEADRIVGLVASYKTTDTDEEA